jgi:hypothetical protein
MARETPFSRRKRYSDQIGGISYSDLLYGMFSFTKGFMSPYQLNAAEILVGQQRGREKT